MGDMVIRVGDTVISIGDMVTNEPVQWHKEVEGSSLLGSPSGFREPLGNGNGNQADTKPCQRLDKRPGLVIYSDIMRQ